jgi:hypothetical protein
MSGINLETQTEFDTWFNSCFLQEKKYVDKFYKAALQQYRDNFSKVVAKRGPDNRVQYQKISFQDFLKSDKISVDSLKERYNDSYMYGICVKCGLDNPQNTKPLRFRGLKESLENKIFNNDRNILHVMDVEGAIHAGDTKYVLSYAKEKFVERITQIHVQKENSGLRGLLNAFLKVINIVFPLKQLKQGSPGVDISNLKPAKGFIKSSKTNTKQQQQAALVNISKGGMQRY